MRTKPAKKTLSARGCLVGSIAVFIVSLFLATVILSLRSNGLQSLKIGDDSLQISFAKTIEEKKAGLCCRDSLPEDQGMLFMYDTPGVHQFWMKNTRIPLDMYWLDSEKKIIHIEHNVMPETYPKTFGPNQPALYVLETNAGYAKMHNIKIGDKAYF